jgi:hypothetical protein
MTVIEFIDFKTLVPAVCNSMELKGYFVNPKSGTIWSTLQGKPKQIKGSNHDGYRRTNFVTPVGNIQLLLHRIVACTLIPFPCPPGISKKDWNNTPNSVKGLMSNQWFINHIDHNRSNYNPTNLEWATSKENAVAREKHYRKVA